MNNLLFAIADELKRLLALWLPELSNNWWQLHVLESLTYHQQDRIKRAGIDSLSGLDLAAILRVLDQNWFELSSRHHWQREGRNWLKETQTIRNRWAHSTISEFVPQDAYRDTDTIERLAQLLGFNDVVLDQIAACKQSQLALITSQKIPALETATLPIDGEMAQKEDSSELFSLGQLVCLKSDAACVFPILSVCPKSGSITRYQVFENGKAATYYESQLEAAPEPPEGRIPIPLSSFNAHLTALLLTSPSATNLYSLHSGRVRFVPYQYRPVLKLLRADRPRLLIADDVGVGKTIEAGLILKELQARTDIRSVLILCPKPLVAEGKWRTEMKRFGEEFTHLDGASLRHCLNETDLDGEWPRQHAQTIIPFSLFDDALLNGKPHRRNKKSKGLFDLDPPPRFDLVIVDEAHHIRNSNTWLHNGVKFFCEHAEAVIFMTATPIQMGNQDLYTLLNVLRPDLVIDQASFEFMAEPNLHIHAAANHLRTGSIDSIRQARHELQAAASTFAFIQSLDFQRLLDDLAVQEIEPAKRVSLIHEIERLSTFDSLINRTRRRDIGNFTTRRPNTIEVPFTEAQRALHDQLISTAARIYARKHGGQVVQFMLSTLRRQAASCLYALAPFIDHWLDNKLDELEMAEIGDEEWGAVGTANIDDLLDEMAELSRAAKNLDPSDPKLDALFSIIGDKQNLPNNKLLLFTSFRHTLFYLEKHLNKAGIRVGVIHGGVPDDERRDLRQRFAMPKEREDALDLLLSTEVGSEGLDFQFCDALINYDLPWNPMRIEQRIGRIDRYGQKSDVVVINNLITPETVDADIYERCLLRIGIFQQALGASEEILGEISKELHAISESFELSPEDRLTRLQQLADNELRHIQEQAQLESRGAELFGLTLPSSDEWDTPTSHWLKPDALLAAANLYLRSRADRDMEFILGAKPLKTLRADSGLRQLLLDDFRNLKNSGQEARIWEKWLKGNDQHIEITFDQDCASDNPDSLLLHPSHPLMRQAAAYLYREATPQYLCCTVRSVELPSGMYPFALYRWHKQGVRPDNELIAVADQTEIESRLFALLQQAEPVEDATLPEQPVFDNLDARHHQRWRDALADHKEANQELVEYRLNSLKTSTNARLRLVKDQLMGATSEKIRIMKQAEFDRIKAEASSQKSKLENDKAASDIRAEAVVFGMLEVMP